MSKRVVLRPDAYRAPVDNGVYILGNAGPVLLTGTSIAQWIDRIAPHLDGRHTLDDLTHGLQPERRQMVERIVKTLRSRDVVRERAADEPSPLEDADAARYAHEIAFLDYFRDSAAATFARYRAATALIVGTGTLLPEVVRAALRSGLRTVRVATVNTVHSDQLAKVEDEAIRRDPGQQVLHEHLPGFDDKTLTQLVKGAELVLQVGHQGPWRQTWLLERCCVQAGVLLLQAVVRNGEAWLVPAADVKAARWASAQRRLRSAAPSDSVNPPGNGRREGENHQMAATTAVASRLVHAAFTALTGVNKTRPPGELVRVDLDTLRSEEHRFLPHPFALPAEPAAEADYRARIAELARDDGLTEAAFSQNAARCVDDRLGIVQLHEHDWAQSPLHVTEASVHDPVGLAETIRTARTSSAGFTYRAARSGATMRGLVRYAELMVDPRRLVDPTGRPLVAPSNDPDAALAALRAESLVGATWGHELTDPDRVRLVPASAVFPRLRTSAPPPETTAGLAAGFDWSGAVLAGLLGHCRRLTLYEVGRATTPYPAVDVTAVELNEDGTRCRDILGALDELPDVYDVTGSLGVPTYAFCAGSGTLAYATGESASAAISLGLLQVLRAVQAHVYRQRALMPSSVPDLPRSLRGRRSVGVDGSTVLTIAAIAGRLRATGQAAVAVPLDHDPHLATIMPFLVHVVICHD